MFFFFIDLLLDLLDFKNLLFCQVYLFVIYYNRYSPIYRHFLPVSIGFVRYPFCLFIMAFMAFINHCSGFARVIA
jgi:membrane protein DedA with SNARE-associated domain